VLPADEKSLIKGEVLMATITIYLKRGDVEAATRAFQMAKVVHAEGHQASMFMSDDGVTWADKNRSLDEKTRTNDTAREFLPYLVENEVPIYV
jgi:tRNA 2-thiouridine synthesizing protein D